LRSGGVKTWMVIVYIEWLLKNAKISIGISRDFCVLDNPPGIKKKSHATEFLSFISAPCPR
jgi:hypothetical protein